MLYAVVATLMVKFIGLIMHKICHTSISENSYSNRFKYMWYFAVRSPRPIRTNLFTKKVFEATITLLTALEHSKYKKINNVSKKYVINILSISLYGR